MAPRKKLTSKRVGTKQRTKIEKKVREHKRKLRKSDGKNVHKSRKDPGIPSMWPLKESLLQKLKADQEKEQLQKEIRASIGVTGLVQDATLKTEKFQSESQAIADAKRRGVVDNSKRAFFKEFKQVVEKADVILQVLDARDPLGCRVKEVEELVLNGGAGKRIVLVLNKIDLVPKEALEGWLKYLRREFPTIAFKASTQSQRSNIGVSKLGAEGSKSDCFGADTLIQLLKNYCRSQNIKTAITVGVVGYPNVGKSSLINSLKRSKVCKVGSTPGVTTSNQEIHLDKNIKLLDSPGIVFTGPSGDDDVFLRNCLKVEQIQDPITPVQKIVERLDKAQLQQLYQLPAFTDSQDFLLLIARKQGKLLKGGLPNYDAAAKSILNDWNQGKIPYYMSPPFVQHLEQPAIVTAWAPEFDLAAIESMEVDTVLPHVQYDPLQAMQEDHVDAHVIPSQMKIGSGNAKTGSGDADTRYDVQLTAEEAACNPQRNKQRAKDAKKARKVAAKFQGAEGEDCAMDIDESYDFAHFQQQ